MLSRALNIFEELNKTKKDDRYDKIIQKNEFYYKCEEMYNICKVNLKKANEILLRDKENEENMKKKTEEDFNEYKKKIEEQKELKEKEEKEKEKVKEIPDERIDEENKEILEIINKRNMELQMEKMKEKGRKGKKRGKKKERRDSEEDEYDDNPDLNLEEKEYEESVRNEEENENKDDNPVNSDYYDDEQEEKKEKSKKRHLLKKRKRSEDEDINLYDKENENKENDNGENNNDYNLLNENNEKSYIFEKKENIIKNIDSEEKILINYNKDECFKFIIKNEKEAFDEKDNSFFINENQNEFSYKNIEKKEIIPPQKLISIINKDENKFDLCNNNYENINKIILANIDLLYNYNNIILNNNKKFIPKVINQVNNQTNFNFKICNDNIFSNNENLLKILSNKNKCKPIFKLCSKPEKEIDEKIKINKKRGRKATKKTKISEKSKELALQSRA